MDKTYEVNAPGQRTVALSRATFEREAVTAAAHAFSRHFRIEIDTSDSTSWVLHLTPFRDGALDHEAETERPFENEVIDHQVRLDLARRTDPLRQRIVEMAFAPAIAALGKSKS